MLTPSQINPTKPNPDSLAEVATLHAAFDSAIQIAAERGEWPATVRSARDGTTHTALASVIEEYRRAGWHVTAGAAGVWAHIDHPDHARPSDYPLPGGFTGQVTPIVTSDGRHIGDEYTAKR